MGQVVEGALAELVVDHPAASCGGPGCCRRDGVDLVIGVLPLGFVVGTSVAIGRVAGAGRVTWGGVLLAAGLAVAALLLQSVLSPFQAAFTELISRRVDGACARRLMRPTRATVLAVALGAEFGVQGAQIRFGSQCSAVVLTAASGTLVRRSRPGCADQPGTRRSKSTNRSPGTSA